MAEDDTPEDDFQEMLRRLFSGDGGQFDPEQLAKLLSSHSEMAGVIIDSAGPTLVVERDALAPVLVLAVDLGD